MNPPFFNPFPRFYAVLPGALLADFIQLFSQEFFVGVELFRPVVIWLALAGLVSPWKARLRRTILYWVPYLILFVAYLYWRLALMPTPGTDRNTPRLLYGLLTTPLESFAELARIFAQSVVEMMLGVWYRTIEPGLFTAEPPANLVAWALAGITTGLLLAFFLWQARRKPGAVEQAGGERDWYATAIPVGFIAMILGFAPGWSIGRHIYDLSGMYNDRFGMAAMFGASLLIVGLVEALLRKETYRVVLLCLLVGLAVGQNFRTANTYRWSWEKQLRLYWQLKWRAPELKPPTTIMGEGALAPYIGSWANTSAIVQMYAPEKDVHYMDFWYLDISKANLMAHVEERKPVEDWKNFMYYSTPAENSIAISYKPEDQQCLWVLTRYDKTNPYITDLEYAAMQLTNLDRIAPETSRTLRADIFGPEIPHDWCYYYQKGDLARQFGDWPEVVRLWNEAEQQDLRPLVGVEYSPFIEGFAHTGDFEQALELTRSAALMDYKMRDYLCMTWNRIGEAASPGEQLQEALALAAEELPCDRSAFP